MKYIIIVVLNLLTCALFGQTPDWSANFYVQRTDGIVSDTITIGLAYDATPGFDISYDQIDTNFSYPVGIRTNSYDVEIDSLTCPANMKTNILPFQDIVTWDVYVISDSFDYFGGEYVTLYWDTSDFTFNDGSLSLEYVYATSNINYFCAIDLNAICISTNYYCYGYGGFYYDRAPLVYQFQNPDEYITGECATERNIFSFQIHAVINDLTAINSYNDQTSLNITQQVGNIVELSIRSSPITLCIYSLTGELYYQNTFSKGSYYLDCSMFPKGILLFHAINTNNTISKTILNL